MLKTAISLLLVLFTTCYAATESRGRRIIVALDPAKEQIIHLQPLIPTRLTFKTKERWGPIWQGSDIVKITSNRAEQLLEITPQVESGKTAMNMVIGNMTYTFVFIISRDVDPDYQITYSTADSDDDVDFSSAESAPIMKPFEIDTEEIIKEITRAHNDRTYRSTLDEYYIYPIGKPYIWNGCPVTLVEANYFALKDLLVIKLEWYNATKDLLLYLDEKQVEITSQGKPIPVTAWRQTANKLFPKQMDTKWFFIQGLKISPKNNWAIKLPPDAEAVKMMLSKKN